MYVCNSLSETCRVSCTSPREEGLYQNCGGEVLYTCFWRVIPRAWSAAFCNLKLNFTPQTPTPFPNNFSQESLFPHTNYIFPKRSILHSTPKPLRFHKLSENPTFHGRVAFADTHVV